MRRQPGIEPCFPDLAGGDILPCAFASLLPPSMVTATLLAVPFVAPDPGCQWRGGGGSGLVRSRAKMSFAGDRWYHHRMLERLGWRRRSDPPGDAASDIGPLLRQGRLVELREHVPANKEAFQRWYGDTEIATLLRHDLEPLTASQSASYFDSLILPLSQRGLCFAIHERATGRLIGTTALTDLSRRTTGRGSALFRIVIGEKDAWDQGFGTEATSLVIAEAFERHDLSEVRLEVFRHNPRAIAAYTRVGFAITGEHVEWVSRRQRELNVIEMRLRRSDWEAVRGVTPAGDNEAGAAPAGDAAEAIAAATETDEARAARLARRRDMRRTRRKRSPATRPGTDDDAQEDGASDLSALLPERET